MYVWADGKTNEFVWVLVEITVCTIITFHVLSTGNIAINF